MCWPAARQIGPDSDLRHSRDREARLHSRLRPTVLASGLGLRVKGSGFRVQGVGFRAEGSGCGV